MTVCKCCSNGIGIDGEDLVIKSKRAFVECVDDADHLTGKVARGRTEIRITLDNANALAIIDNLICTFPEVKKHLRSIGNGS